MSAPTGSDARPTAPFGFLRPAVLVAGGYAVAAVVWLWFGEVLPGGRWFAVHLFTLGVLSNLVVALTHHFAQTLLHARDSGNQRWRFALLNAGALGLLAFPPSLRWPVAAGATLLAAAVAWLWFDLRRMRRSSLTGRFAFVVRGYQHACLAFLGGAALGGLLGVGALGGTWFGAARLAHLHLNVLGWGGLTLLATVVFFGPTIMRVRMRPGADIAAARALRLAAGGLLLAGVGLLATGAGGALVVPSRLLAAAGLVLYAVAVTVACAAVVRGGRGAKPSAPSWMIRSACVWFAAVAWADVLVVATGRVRLLDAVGAALLAGVLAQAIAASLEYLTPMVWGRGREHRAAVQQRLAVLPRWRLVAHNSGVALVVVAAVAGPGAALWGAVAARAGWFLIGVAVLAQLVVLARGPARPPARGAVAPQT